MPVLEVAFDYICPWCFVAWEQAKRLKGEFPTLEFRWRGFELMPESLPPVPKSPEDPNPPKKPRVPSRFELLEHADGIYVPKRTRPYSLSRKALEGAEYAFEQGKADAYHEAVYQIYWAEDADFSQTEVLAEIAKRAGLDVDSFFAALEDRRYSGRIVEYDDPAHEAGVWNVPTWMFPEEWIAEQPLKVLREYAARFVDSPSV